MTMELPTVGELVAAFGQKRQTDLGEAESKKGSVITIDTNGESVSVTPSTPGLSCHRRRSIRATMDTIQGSEAIIKDRCIGEGENACSAKGAVAG